MSKVIIIPILLVSSMIFTASAEWHADNIWFTGQTPAIGLDSSGLPRIAFGQPGTGARLIRSTGSVWTTPDVIYSAYYGDAEYFDIVIDESDITHVAFSHVGMIFYAVEDPSLDSWTVQTPSADGVWNSLDLSSQNSPGISYCNYTDDLEYVFWNGSEWTTEVVDSSGDTGNYNSLVREGINQAHIAYSMELPTAGLRYANRNESGVWQTIFVDTTMASEPMGMSIALDGEGYPRISYTTTEDLRYASWSGSEWNVETVWSLSGDDAKDTGANCYGTSLVLFDDEYPHIAHCALNGDSLLYSWNDGTCWQTESVYPLEGNPEGYGDPDLAMDSEGRPHIAFSGIEGLCYAYNDEQLSVSDGATPDWPLSLVTAENPFYGRLNVTFNLMEAGNVDLTVYDLQGREVETLLSNNQPAGNSLCTWTPESSVPCGEYILVLNANGNILSQKVVYLK